MKDNYKELPEFADEDEEREFWVTHDSTEYIDWENGQSVVFAKLWSHSHMKDSQPFNSIKDQIKAGLLDDILARIDAEYANYKQTPVFTCQEEELAYWSRTAPADSNETSSDSTPEKPDR